MDDQLIVDTDELFNLTVLIVDKYTQTAVNNISWRVRLVQSFAMKKNFFLNKILLNRIMNGELQ